MRVHVLLEGYWHHLSPDDLGLGGCPGYGTLRTHVAWRLGIDMTRLSRHEIESSPNGDLILRPDDVIDRKTPERAPGPSRRFAAPLFWFLEWRRLTPHGPQPHAAGTKPACTRRLPSAIHAPPGTEPTTPSRITGR